MTVSIVLPPRPNVSSHYLEKTECSTAQLFIHNFISQLPEQRTHHTCWDDKLGSNEVFLLYRFIFSLLISVYEMLVTSFNIIVEC